MRYFDEPQEIRELEGKAKIKRSIGAIFAYRSSREAVSKKYLGAERASEEGPTRALAAECQAQGFFEMASVGPPRTDDAAPLLVPGPTAPSIAYPGLNAMQYTKSMIDQVFLIRKIVPAPARAHVKLTNPALLDLLVDLYREVEDLLLRDLIRQLMSMAGPAWITRLQTNYEVQESSKKEEHQPHQQVYRGHTIAAATPSIPSVTQTPAAVREKTVIYRGHTVALSH